MERDRSHNHRWNIDVEGKGICLQCGEVRQFPTPSTVGNYLSKRQLTKGIAEAERYNKLQNRFSLMGFLLFYTIWVVVIIFVMVAAM